MVKMLYRHSVCFVLSFLILFLSIFPFKSGYAETAPNSAMVATAQAQATQAALDVLKAGGNAVDAAIAAQWVLNVTEPYASGLGGGGFFLYYEAATKRIYTFDGREKAPQDLTPEVFLDEHKKPYEFFPDRITGGLAVGVPGTLRLLKTVHERFSSGAFTFERLFDPAIEIAEKGFPVTPRLWRMIDSQKERLRLFPDSKKIFLTEEGEALPLKTNLVQKDLAETFRWIQRKGVNDFYEGELADKIINAVRYAPFHPGLMTRRDLFYYQPLERDAVYGTYRGYTLFSMGPPSSGGTTLIETLNILENFDVGSLNRNKDFVHLFAETQKLAFQDRNRYAGDIDFTPVPVGYLVSKELGKDHSEQISVRTALPTSEQKAEGGHTSHISIVDASGNMVSFTTTIEHMFGSAMIVPGHGFFLNNELTDFDAEPYDDQGRLKANAPQGEKRPRSSMTPVFVFKDGKPFLVTGSPGGSTIIGTVLNILVNLIDFKMPADDAVRAPRIINRDGAVELETALFNYTELRQALVAKGHEVVRNRFFGNAQTVYFDPKTKSLIGVSDPRGDGRAQGY